MRIALSDCDLLLSLYARGKGRNLAALRGKVVWITGASSGIGEELAYSLAGLGSKLILSARREVELQRVLDNCKSRTNDLLHDELDIYIIIYDNLYSFFRLLSTRMIT